MRVRKVSSTGDRVFGGGLRAFYVDVPEAPALAVTTRLALRLGEWFLDTSDGTPWYTQVLGKYTGSTRDPIVQSRVLGTPGVNGLLSYASQVDTGTRGFSVQTTISTVYGEATMTLEQVETSSLRARIVTVDDGTPVTVDPVAGSVWTV